MYKLVIVEDEDNIRSSLEKFFPWKELGFEVVKSFSDGLGALEYIRKNPCDAILTDIRMERMDGLEMIQELCGICPDIKVVILSGFSDFEYAQKAIRFRVVDYLLKPVDEEKLAEVFQKIKEQLDEEKRVNSSGNNHQELRKLLQQNLFRNLLKSFLVTRNELLVYLQFLGIEEKCVEYPVTAFQIHLKKDEEDEGITDIDRVEVNDALYQYFSISEGPYQSFVYDDWDDKWCIAVICREKRDLKEQQIYWKKMAQDFIQNYKPHMRSKLSCTLMKRVDRMSQLLRQEDNREQQCKLVWQTNEQNELYQNSIPDYKLLVVELDLGSQEAVRYIIDNMLGGLRGGTLEQVKFVLKNLYSAIEAEYRNRKVDIQTITNRKFNYEKYDTIENFENIVTCVREDFRDLCEKMEEKKWRQNYGFVDKIIQYMNEHMDEDVGQKVIAEKFKMHPGYFSRLFKETTGETFSGYFSRIRIERGAQLLKDERKKIREISNSVGFSNTAHFTAVFRKYTGLSPTDYRQRMILL